MALITFEQFMQHALHDPREGYYARRIRAVGRSGDFTTAPMLSESPALSIARWALKAMRETGCRDLIEMGPGQGTLAAAVLRHLPWHVRWRARLHLVETSRPMMERQRKALGNHAIWHANPAQAMHACGGRAVIWSNELVDAFAVRRFQKTDVGWQEIGLETGGSAPVEVLLPPAPLPDSSVFSIAHPLGQRVEIHQSYQNHLAEWLPSWKAGRMLTIDYGAEAGTLYHRRPHGTLRAYFHHQRLEGQAIYQNPGHQDLTADVNFTDLQDWSLPWAATRSIMKLREFLRNPADPMADPSGAGDAFVVLEQMPGNVRDTKKP